MPQIPQMQYMRKPAAPKPPKVYTPRGEKWAKMLKGRKYQSTNHMARIEKENVPDGVSRILLESVKQFEARYAAKWRGKHFDRPADLERYVLWLYATGSREGEPFIKPYPRISVMKPRDLPWKIVKVIRVIEKSFTKGTKEREIIEQHIPVFDQAEEEIWRKILDDYELTDLDDLFERMAKHFHCRKSGKRSGNLSTIVQHNFRAEMRTGDGKLLKNAPISIHALRHHRAYSLLVQRGLDDDLVTSLFGWHDPRMCTYYAYLSREIKGQAQLLSLKKYAKELKER